MAANGNKIGIKRVRYAQNTEDIDNSLKALLLFTGEKLTQLHLMPKSTFDELPKLGGLANATKFCNWKRKFVHSSSTKHGNPSIWIEQEEQNDNNKPFSPANAPTKPQTLTEFKDSGQECSTHEAELDKELSDAEEQLRQSKYDLDAKWRKFKEASKFYQLEHSKYEQECRHFESQDGIHTQWVSSLKGYDPWSGVTVWDAGCPRLICIFPPPVSKMYWLREHWFQIKGGFTPEVDKELTTIFQRHVKLIIPLDNWAYTPLLLTIEADKLKQEMPSAELLKTLCELAKQEALETTDTMPVKLSTKKVKSSKPNAEPPKGKGKKVKGSQAKDHSLSKGHGKGPMARLESQISTLTQNFEQMINKVRIEQEGPVQLLSTKSKIEGAFDHTVGGTNNCIILTADHAFYQAKDDKELHEVARQINGMYCMHPLDQLKNADAQAAAAHWIHSAHGGRSTDIQIQSLAKRYSKQHLCVNELEIPIAREIDFNGMYATAVSLNLVEGMMDLTD
ncbi:hypothetical protein BC830DRAFT_1173835 [Chytriomyces sp. MP71]|nr:hypothetical protein BC830DRAFT_1173835 [Chytriomyces sp. MP71]